jgi:hypothetical protein
MAKQEQIDPMSDPTAAIFAPKADYAQQGEQALFGSISPVGMGGQQAQMQQQQDMMMQQQMAESEGSEKQKNSNTKPKTKPESKAKIEIQVKGQEKKSNQQKGINNMSYNDVHNWFIAGLTNKIATSRVYGMPQIKLSADKSKGFLSGAESAYRGEPSSYMRSASILGATGAGVGHVASKHTVSSLVDEAKKIHKSKSYKGRDVGAHAKVYAKRILDEAREFKKARKGTTLASLGVGAAAGLGLHAIERAVGRAGRALFKPGDKFQSKTAYDAGETATVGAAGAATGGAISAGAKSFINRMAASDLKGLRKDVNEIPRSARFARIFAAANLRRAKEDFNLLKARTKFMIPAAALYGGGLSMLGNRVRQHAEKKASIIPYAAKAGKGAERARMAKGKEPWRIPYAGRMKVFFRNLLNPELAERRKALAATAKTKEIRDLKRKKQEGIRRIMETGKHLPPKGQEKLRQAASRRVSPNKEWEKYREEVRNVMKETEKATTLSKNQKRLIGGGLAGTAFIGADALESNFNRK